MLEYKNAFLLLPIEIRMFSIKFKFLYIELYIYQLLFYQIECHHFHFAWIRLIINAIIYWKLRLRVNVWLCITAACRPVNMPQERVCQCIGL